jgi:hypothetical protein
VKSSAGMEKARGRGNGPFTVTPEAKVVPRWGV